jgi:hypothetical protein
VIAGAFGLNVIADEPEDEDDAGVDGALDGVLTTGAGADFAALSSGRCGLEVDAKKGYGTQWSNSGGVGES